MGAVPSTAQAFPAAILDAGAMQRKRFCACKVRRERWTSMKETATGYAK